MARFIVRIDDREQTAIAELESIFDCEELVCCQDCKYQGNHIVCPIFSPKKDWFCANGERKDE